MQGQLRAAHLGVAPPQVAEGDDVGKRDGVAYQEGVALQVRVQR